MTDIIPADILAKAERVKDEYFDGDPNLDFRALIARALQEERERCAKIADSFTCGLCGMDGKAGDAIRAGGGEMFWLTTAPNPRSRSTGFNAGQRGWKLHAVPDATADAKLPLTGVRSACGIRPRHGWDLDMYIEDRCTRCQAAVTAILQPPKETT